MMIGVLALTALSLGSQTPSLPRLVIAPELRTTNCAAADERRRLLDQGEAAFEAARPLMQDANAGFEARMNAHADRLIARGVWAEVDRARFNRQLLASPEFESYALQLASIISSMMESLEAIISAAEDEEGGCRALLAMLGQIDRSVAVGEEGWNLIDRAYAEEARRLGVSLN